MHEEIPICEKLTFAMGCFWGPEDRFAKLPGVTATRVGYSGGEVPIEALVEAPLNRTSLESAEKSFSDRPAAPAPTHRRLAGHSETVEVEFDPRVVSLEELLEKFWNEHNPAAIEGYKPDDSRYRSMLFYRNEEQRAAMERMQSEMADQGRHSQATVLLSLGAFYPAEEKHQRYEEKKRQRNGTK